MSNVEQYNAIRATISSNLETIKSLLAQANSLHETISDLDGSVDEQGRRQLNNAVQNIYKSIDLLIMQTDALLKTFIAYSNSREGVAV